MENTNRYDWFSNGKAWHILDDVTHYPRFSHAVCNKLILPRRGTEIAWFKSRVELEPGMRPCPRCVESEERKLNPDENNVHP
jgi:hypothetical protein